MDQDLATAVPRMPYSSTPCRLVTAPVFLVPSMSLSCPHVRCRSVPNADSAGMFWDRAVCSVWAASNTRYCRSSVARAGGGGGHHHIQARRSSHDGQASRMPNPRCRHCQDRPTHFIASLKNGVCLCVLWVLKLLAHVLLRRGAPCDNLWRETRSCAVGVGRRFAPTHVRRIKRQKQDGMPHFGYLLGEQI